VKNINLNGSPKHSHQLKFCDKCETKQPPEGGIQMRPGRWLCASCWLARNRKEQKK
jgi:hypothetical protein